MLCPYNISCEDIQLDLERIGIALECETCLDTFCELAEQGGNYNAFILAKAGLSEAAVACVRSEVKVWRGVTCVHTRMAPVGVCIAESCLSWISYPQAGNCFRVYMSERKPTTRSLSCIYNIPESEVKDLFNKGRALAARNYLKNDSVAKIDQNRCACCGKTPTLVMDGWAYCSPECAEKKPPLYCSLEAYFGMNLKDLLAKVRVLKHIVPDVLGVDESTTSMLYSQVGVSLQTALTRRTSRRTDYKGCWGGYQKFLEDYYSEYGYPQTDGEQIREEIDALLDSFFI